MNLQSVTGNISVSGANPSEIGDVFKAKTNNGAISLAIDRTPADGSKYEFRLDQIYRRNF